MIVRVIERRILIVVLSLLLTASSHSAQNSQGMATGNVRQQAARPLPKGAVLPSLRYVDVAADAGFRQVNVSGAETAKQYIVETTGNGVAIFDYDGDGLQDVLFINASQLSAKGNAATHHLYRNLGGLRFEDVTEKAGIQGTTWGQGVCAGDVDNDGKVDIVITNWGPNTVYRNLGNGTFRDESTRLPKTEKKRWSTGCAFIDYDRDGDLDLFIANYVDFDMSRTPRPNDGAHCVWKGLPVICGPRGLPGESMMLYRNDGKGQFTDVSKEAGITTDKNYYGFTVLTGDFDNDGWPDVYVACDSTASLFFRNKKNGTFEEVGVFSGAALNENGREQAGMGVAAADYDGDGLLDIFKTNFTDDTPTLYHNDGDFTFSDRTIRAGLGVNTKFLGWGAAFMDVDHDGRQDIFHVNGHVYPEIDASTTGEKFKQRRVIYWNSGNSEFHDISAQAGPGISALHSSRGIAVADLDNDGTQEIVVVNMHEAPSLLKNQSKVANSVLISALTASGRDAIGARITVEAGGTKQIDEIRSGGTFISQGDFRAHFGLANHPSAKLTIRWPDGTSQPIGTVTANHWTIVQQGKGIVKSQPLGSAK